MPLTGTLKDGVLEIQDDSVVTRYLKAGMEMPDWAGNLEAVPNDTGRLAGLYTLYAMEVAGVRYDYAALVEMDMMDSSYLRIDYDAAAGYTGELSFEGEEPDTFTLEYELSMLNFASGDQMGFYEEEPGVIGITHADLGGTIFFALDSVDRSAGANPDAASAETEDETDPLLAWWNGNWYGCKGKFADLEGEYWDCEARIEISSDYTGTMEMWDDDMPRTTGGIGSVHVSLSDNGVGEHSTLMSEGGWFMEKNLAHADWIIDPALSGFENMLVITGDYDDDNGNVYYYKLMLRPWGQIWDDVAEESRQWSYEEWYLPLIDAGKAMPDNIGADVVTQGTDTTGNSTEPEPQPDGRSTADAAGQVSRQVMDTAIVSLKGDFIWDDVKYSDIRELLGTDGVPYKVNDAWRDDFHTYEWSAPENITLLVSFNVKNGEEISCSWSSGNWTGPAYDVKAVSLGSRPTGTGKMLRQSVKIVEFSKAAEATVSFEIPEGAWCVKENGSSFKIINNPTPDDAPYNTPYIKIEIKKSLDKINSYQDSYENLTELELRTIGGIEMIGRAFTDLGIDWVQYYAELPNGGWISIDIAYATEVPAAGSACSNILDSISFR